MTLNATVPKMRWVVVRKLCLEKCIPITRVRCPFAFRWQLARNLRCFSSNEQPFISFQTGAGDIPDDPIPSNSETGNEIMGDDDESSRSSSEDCATLPSGDIDGVVGEPDTSSSDSSDASTSAESTLDEIYDTSMEEVLEQGRQINLLVGYFHYLERKSNPINQNLYVLQKPYFGSIVTGSVASSAAAASIVPSLQLAAASVVMSDTKPRTIPTKVTLAPPPLQPTLKPSKPTLSVQRPVVAGATAVATPAVVEKRQMVRCDDRLTLGNRTLAGIVISSGPGGHFETYEGQSMLPLDFLTIVNIFHTFTVVEALNVNNMLAKFEAADPSCVDGPEDPRRKAEIMAAVKNHFSSPCRRMPPGKVPKIGMFTYIH